MDKKQKIQTDVYQRLERQLVGKRNCLNWMQWGRENYNSPGIDSA
jgi:hypothetical protein